MRLIDAETLKKIIPETKVNGLGGCAYCTLLDAEQIEEIIDSAPTIDAEPVVHARWTMHSDRPDTIICTRCNEGFDVWKHDKVRMKRCPNCGAKMDGGGRE